jgi:hypothetical protein
MAHLREVCVKRELAARAEHNPAAIGQDNRIAFAGSRAKNLRRRHSNGSPARRLGLCVPEDSRPEDQRGRQG